MNRWDKTNVVVAVVLVLFAVVSVSEVFRAHAADSVKIPVEMQNRILKVENDQLQQKDMLNHLVQRCTQEYPIAQTQQTIAHDDGELQKLRSEALATAKLDPAKWDMNIQSMEFVEKPKAAEPGKDAK
jgi:hypothetical protein